MLSALKLIPLLILLYNGEALQKGLLDFIFSPCKCRCGVPNREAKFHGGEFLRGHEFPWAAIVQTLDKEPRSFIGSLINNKYVITAASPLVGLAPYFVKVGLGTYNKCLPDISSTNVSIEEVIIHPGFSAENYANDIALLKLSNPILFERRISPICLSMPGNHYLGQVSTIVSWPVDQGSNEPSCRPKKLGLPILGEECLETTPFPGSFSDDKGCIGLVGTNSVICEEDAGVPVMFRSHGGIYELIGVLTGQNDCKQGKSTGFYTKINNHLGWIIQNTKDACYCVKT